MVVVDAVVVVDKLQVVVHMLNQGAQGRLCELPRLSLPAERLQL